MQCPAWTLCLLVLWIALPVHAADRNATRYPIILSHHWSGTAAESFMGDNWEGSDFTAWGVKHALEAEGAVVYQPDKTPFASHEIRGRLLYRKCAGESLEAQLCEGDDPLTVDGVECFMVDYCRDENKRGDAYASYDDCIDRIKFNIICHSQGCPDSRYMISAMRCRLSGRPMYEHVASWTSIAGANKGTALVDATLAMVGPCNEPECQGPDFVEAMLEENGVKENGRWVEGGYASLVALSRKYMTQTMDMDCNLRCEDCPPGFNQAYPNPEGIYYQSYTSSIRWLHPCYDDMAETWLLLTLLEGENDGWISVESQKFLTAGRDELDPPTHVVYRGHVTGASDSCLVKHPGLSHMGLNNSRVPGMGNVTCEGTLIDQEIFHFSREGFYQEVVEDLKRMGF